MNKPTKIEETFKENGYVRLTGMNFEDENELLQFSKNFGNTIPQSPESVIKVREEAGSKLRALTRQDLGPHNECVYSNTPPGGLVLYCHENQTEGGEFYLIDTPKVIQLLSQRAIDILSSAKYSFSSQEGAIVSRTPMIQHPSHEDRILFFSLIGEPTYTPLTNNKRKFTIAESTQREVKSELISVLSDPNNRLTYSWESGDLIAFDNYRFMHGRNAYGNSGSRELWHVRLK